MYYQIWIKLAKSLYEFDIKFPICFIFSNNISQKNAVLPISHFEL